MGRPKGTLITRDGAVLAALDVIDESGLTGFNLAMVAKRLGVAAPSLYHHFRDRDEVLAEVARLLLARADPPDRPQSADWRTMMVDLAVAARRSILCHPKAAPLLMMFPPRHIAATSYERSLRVLTACGVPPALHLTLLSGMEAVLFGSALLASGARVQGIDLLPPLDPEKSPALVAAVEANRLDDEAMFVATAEGFLEGIYPKAVEEARRGRMNHLID